MNIFRAKRTASTAFHFLRCDTDDITNVVMAIRGDGRVASDVAGVTTPADYAEYMECSDPSGIPVGYAVSINSSGLIDIATNKTKIVGFVSAAPAHIADAAWNHWHNKYLKDDFGARILNEDGEAAINPVWNSGLPYVPREDRPEWVAIGLVGKLWVRTNDETLLMGDYVTGGANGMVIGANPGETPRWPIVQSGLAFDPAKGYGTARILYS